MTTYKIDYCNNFFLTVDAGSSKEAIEKAIEKALEGAAHTQCDIKIRDEDCNTIAISKWYGVPPEDWDKPLLIIGGGFYDAFQDIEYSEYI